LQGKALSYNNVHDASAAVALARALPGPGCVIVKHTNPCGAAEREAILEAWQAALSGDPVSAFGGVVALTREVDRPLAEAMTSIFLEVIIAPGFDDGARKVLAAKQNLRLIVDPSLAGETDPGWSAATAAIRTAGGAVLVSTPDSRPDDPADWATLSSRKPTPDEQRDLELAWRLVRGATSNAIVLVKDGREIGLGSGQTSRVDAARQAVDKARAISGADSLVGAACASDAFYPFPDAVEVCLEAGVSAFVQPGGSVRDAEILSAIEQAGATMLITGTRHFRH
jgi:phosphoribosylaminoimidazolecarboxamide formyltransferase/IMP cyclohydrolase